MNFYEARAISAAGLHVRREDWSDPDQWWIHWRGVWWFFTTGVKRVVTAGDYGADDLRATDFTTVPAALTACPVTPTSPGGAPPVPGGPGFPAPPTPPFPIPIGTPVPGGGTPISTLPPPSPGGLSVTFAGIAGPNGFTPAEMSDGDPNGTYACRSTGLDVWMSALITIGHEPDPGPAEPGDPDPGPFAVQMSIEVSRNSLDQTFTISCATNLIGGGIFFTPGPGGFPRNQAIPNELTTGIWSGGTATVN